MPLRKDQPCWGEDGLPLILPSFQKVLHDSNQTISAIKSKTPQKASLLCAETIWSNFTWNCPPTIFAVEQFQTLLSDKKNHYLLKKPILKKPLENLSALSHIPFLCTTWEKIEELFPNIEHFAARMHELTILDLLELTKSPQAVLDVAITTPSWTTDSTQQNGKLSIITPILPTDIENAVNLSVKRHARMSCMPEHLIEETNWPVALANRAGYTLNKKLTLEQWGGILNVTRERVRQMGEKYPFVNTRRRWPLPNWLQEILDYYIQSVNLFLEDAEIKLFEYILGEENPNNEVLADLTLQRATSLLDMFGHSIGLELDYKRMIKEEGTAIHLPPKTISKVQGLVWKHSQKSGFLLETDIYAPVGKLLPSLDEDGVTDVLDFALKDLRLPLGYLFYNNRDDNVITNTVKKMLAWANPLPIRVLYDGLCRRFKFRQLITLPPLEVISALLDKYDDFTRLDGDQILDLNPFETDTETVLGKIGLLLQNANGNVLHRSVIFEELSNQGQKISSLGVYLQFGEIVLPAGLGCIRLIGSAPTQSQINSARSYGLATSTKTEHSFSHTDVGLSLAVTVGNTFRDTGVLTIPKDIAHILAGRKFAVCSDIGSHGNLKTSDTFLYGFAPALNALGVKPGDKIKTELCLQSNTAKVVLLDSSSNDEQVS